LKFIILAHINAKYRMIKLSSKTQAKLELELWNMAAIL